jgi:hypothetical protein
MHTVFLHVTRSGWRTTGMLQSFPIKLTIAFTSVIVWLLSGMTMPAHADGPPSKKGMSPALCGPDDTAEPGIQGEVPAGQKANYNCGLKLVGELPRSGNVQGAGTCAYVRSGSTVFIIDVSNPAKPVEAGSVPVQGGSETMRAVVARDRAVLVSGSSVYDISNCLHPVLAGEIKWPPVGLPGQPAPVGLPAPVRSLPHDLRLNRGATKVYASFGVWEADITNLKDPTSWKVTDYRCDVNAQIPGPWSEPHRVTLKAGLSLCADATRPAPAGANYVTGASGLQSAMFWPQVAHSPDFNADDTRLYVGDQAGGAAVNWQQPKVHIIDLTRNPPKVLGEVDGPGHGLDWFRSANGREYVLHSNEGGTGNIAGLGQIGDPCKPHPRPTSLGWAFQAYISDVTRPDKARNVSMVTLAINEPEFCEVRRASKSDPWTSYHMVDNPLNAKFAAVSFGSSGLRVFDIRKPEAPREVAYFNHGPLVHVGVSHYDSARGLLYVPGARGFWVLEIEPQVRANLGL